MHAWEQEASELLCKDHWISELGQIIFDQECMSNHLQNISYIGHRYITYIVQGSQ